MRSMLLFIVLLTVILLGWRYADSEPLVTAEPASSPAVATSSPQPEVQPSFDGQTIAAFAPRERRRVPVAVGLPPEAADLSHVRDFDFDAAALRRLHPGDQLRIDFPPLGGRYDLQIEEVMEVDGERVIRGRIAYDQRDYPGLITLGGDWSFGSFSTPEGHFEFTARNGVARMVDGAELERRAYAPNHTLMPRRS